MSPRSPSSSRLRRDGLTLLEILLSMAVLAMVLMAIAATMTSMQNIWLRIRGKSDQYRSTRMAVDTIAGRLTEATLATRMVRDPTATGSNDKFLRESDLHFVCGTSDQLLQGVHGIYSGGAVFFQAPFGEHGTDGVNQPYDKLNNALCAWGYFVEYGSDSNERPAFLQEHKELAPARMRFRLMEFRQPAHELSLFEPKSSTDTKPKLSDLSPPNLYDWFQKPLRNNSAALRHVSIVAENVLAMVLTPIDPDPTTNAQISGGDGIYDTRRFQWAPNSTLADATRHRLPPVLQLTIIAMSEDEWSKMSDDEIGVKASQLRGLISGRLRGENEIIQDLHFIEAELTRMKMPHRIVTTKIKTNG